MLFLRHSFPWHYPQNCTEYWDLPKPVAVKLRKSEVSARAKFHRSEVMTARFAKKIKLRHDPREPCTEAPGCITIFAAPSPCDFPVTDRLSLPSRTLDSCPETDSPPHLLTHDVLFSKPRLPQERL